MKKISGDIFFYYRVFAWLIIMPAFSIFFISKVLIHAFPKDLIYVICIALAVIFVFQWLRIIKYRKIIYGNGMLLIKSYFNNNSTMVPVDNIISLVQKSNFYGLNVIVSNKMIFVDADKQRTIYFYRSLALADEPDLINYLKREEPPVVFPSYKPAIDIKKRLLSAVFDHIIMTIIAMVFSIPYMIKMFATDFADKPGEIPGRSIPLSVLSCLMFVGFALYFCKDCIFGQSFAKRELKLQVINNKTGLIANPLRCFVRNLFIVLWPIEGIAILLNPARRLGDIIAGTKIVVFDAELKRPELNYYQLAVSFLLSYSFILLVSFWPALL